MLILLLCVFSSTGAALELAAPQLKPDISTTMETNVFVKVNMLLKNVLLLTENSFNRSAAYNLLCALTCTFNLKIEGQLLETSGLCIPANNTLFIVSISKTLAANEPHLTLEFLEECISGFSKSSQCHMQTNTHHSAHM